MATITATMDVGGASFTLTRQVSVVHEDDLHHRHSNKKHRHQATASATATATTTLLVAKGRSYLSYFYVGVCSSVLYLPPEVNNHANNALLFSTADHHPIATALEIYYHKPVRASELRWATNKFIEANLVVGGASNSSGNNNKIANLPEKIQHHLSTFNSLYRNIKVGDRYTLEYHPEVGIRLYLNHELLGTVGNYHPPVSNNHQQHQHHHMMDNEERVELARIIFSVWFGSKSPFSESMKRELLTPIVPPVPVVVDTVVNSVAPSSGGYPHHHVQHNHHRKHHNILALTSSTTWKGLLSHEKHIGVVLEILLVLIGVIVALSLWIQVRRRKTPPSTSTAIEAKNNNAAHLPSASSSYSSRAPQQLLIGSRPIVTLTGEERKMLDSLGVCHLLAIYYYSLRDVVVSAA
jgi:hypothetical protein